MIARQNHDGSWTHSSADTPAPTDCPLRVPDLDATAECTLWMTNIGANVTSRDVT
jgi:hypothetical protein